MKSHTLFKPITLMAAVFQLLTFNISSFANESLIKEPPHRIYHVLQDKTLKQATQQIAQRSSIHFKVNTANQADIINVKLAAEDWKTALSQFLRGYNFSTISAKGEIKEVIVTGENGSGKSAAEYVAVQRNGLDQLPAQYRHFKPGSVMPVNFPLAAIKATQLGKKVILDLPIGQYRINHDNFVKHADGSSTWIGYLDGEGKGYRFYLSEGKAGLMGNVYTPDGVYNIDTEDGKTYLVDVNNSGLESAGYENDQVPVTEGTAFFPAPLATLNPSAAALTSTDSTPNPASGIPGTFGQTKGTVVVDLMVLYTATRQSVDYAEQRIKTLVDMSNQAYLDSHINLQLRLVHTELTAYSESSRNSTALSDLANNFGAFEGTEALRNKYGADLVMLFRPLYARTSGSCGVTYVGFAFGSRADSRYAYGTISNGYSRDSLANRYCDTSTFAHEIGHSFGNVHDREYSYYEGKFPYSYAWGINGRFGTIMSYKHPKLMLFSNPDLATQCSGGPCGYPEGDVRASDQAKTINVTAPEVANYRPTKVAATTQANQ